MIHAICDFCGCECSRNAMLLTITPFQNFARYETDTKPFGHTDTPKSFVICSVCRVRHRLPNPLEDYRELNEQLVQYQKYLDKEW